MERIDSVDGLFHEGNPASGQKGTKVTAFWLNSTQEELAGVVEEAGLVLDLEDNTQLLKAIQSGKLQDVIYAKGYATLALADAAAVVAGKQLVISSVWDIPIAETLDSNVHVLPGGGFNVADAISFMGTVSAGLYQILWGAGTAYYGKGSVAKIPVQWRGVTADDVDSTTAMLRLLGDIAISPVKSTDMVAGKYRFTDTLPLPLGGCQISGDHRHDGFWGGTEIYFAPTSLKNLFQPASSNTLQDGFVLENLYIEGNSIDANGFSDVGLAVIDIINSRFTNLRIQKFRTGVRCEATINNRFEYMRIAGCTVQDVSYTGRYASSDIWDQPYLSTAPIGVNTAGINFGVVWRDAKFESLDNWGMNIAKETYGFCLTGHTYSEHVPVQNVEGGCLIRVGFDGAVLAATPQLICQGGGILGGTNGVVGERFGVVFDVDYTSGLIVGGFIATRWNRVIRTTANTPAKSILCTGWESDAALSQVSDETKVSGMWPIGSYLDAAKRSRQQASFNSIVFPNDPDHPLNDYRRYEPAGAACTGALTTVAQWKAVKVGDSVNLTLPPVSGVATAAAYFQFGAVLPGAYCPTAALWFPCCVKDAEANQVDPGAVYISAAGIIRVYKNLAASSNFTAGGTAGLGQGGSVNVSWVV